MLRDHEHADKLKSDKQLKEGTKFTYQLKEGKAQGAFTYQLKVMHSCSMVYTFSYFCVSCSFGALFVLANVFCSCQVFSEISNFCSVIFQLLLIVRIDLSLCN